MLAGRGAMVWVVALLWCCCARPTVALQSPGREMVRPTWTPVWLLTSPPRINRLNTLVNLLKRSASRRQQRAERKTIFEKT